MSTEAMEAGRELDALIAEKVFGHVLANAPCGDGLTRTEEFEAATMVEADAAIRSAYPKQLAVGRLWPAQYIGPDYSTDIAAAWQVVEAMRERGLGVYVQANGTQWNAPVRASIGSEEAEADTAPLAICRAALAAATD